MVEVYSYSWTCGFCDHRNEVPLSKREAVFFDTLVEQPACMNCQSKAVASADRQMPELDEALLMEWAKDLRLDFVSDDEDIMLASVPMQTLLKVLETDPIEGKRGELISGILVKFHDREFDDEAEAQVCRSWLEANKDAWDTAVQLPYLRDIVRRRLEDEAA